MPRIGDGVGDGIPTLPPKGEWTHARISSIVKKTVSEKVKLNNWHDRNLLNAQVDVVLYDLTTLRFESVREDIGTLRRFGCSIAPDTSSW